MESCYASLTDKVMLLSAVKEAEIAVSVGPEKRLMELEAEIAAFQDLLKGKEVVKPVTTDVEHREEEARELLVSISSNRVSSSRHRASLQS